MMEIEQAARFYIERRMEFIKAGLEGREDLHDYTRAAFDALDELNRLIREAMGYAPLGMEVA